MITTTVLPTTLTIPAQEFLKHESAPTKFLSKVSSLWHTIHDKAEMIQHSKFIKKIQSKYEEFSPIIYIVIDHVSKAAFPILWGTTSFFLLTAQSSLFSIGVLSGVLAPAFMQQKLDQIHNAWNAQPFPTKALIIGGSVLAWPIALASSAVFVGASIGISLQKTTKKVISPST